jgi:regulatory protein
MPKITQITVQSNKKNRCNLFVDGEFAFGLAVETAMKYRRKVGQEISDDELKKIVQDGERKDALEKAVNYLSKSLKTKQQVKIYLLGKGYSEETAYYVIDKLKEYNYINDEEYVKRYLECCSKNQGKRLSEYKLMMKGVRKDVVEKAYEQAEVPDKENALKVAEKYMRNKENTKENLVKAYRYLIGRGFSYEEADYALSGLKDND